MRAISGQQPRLVTQLGCQCLQIQRAASRCHCEQLQHTAIATLDVTLAFDADEPGSWTRGRCARRNPCPTHLPTLTLDSGEGPGKWRCHRPYQVVNLLCRPGPVDPAIFGA